MQQYSTVIDGLVEGLVTETNTHEAGRQFPYHYHEVDEWLQIQQGGMTFFPAAGLEPAIDFATDIPLAVSLSAGDVLFLPRGEIHRVEIGANGVTYQLWTQPYQEPFAKPLDDALIDLVTKNLRLPNAENCWDARNQEALTKEDELSMNFLGSFVSNDLTFRTAGGKLFIGKDAYLNRKPADITRYPSVSVYLLDKKDESILLSTVVKTRPKGEGSTNSYLNFRLFVMEEKKWKCRLWINYPDNTRE
jgi:hypothetical protein